VGVALNCTQCGAASVSSLFYRGPETHVCQVCGGDLSLMDPARDRRRGADRRQSHDDVRWVEWRSGEERRGAHAALAV
jgi:hypothetical protein